LAGKVGLEVILGGGDFFLSYLRVVTGWLCPTLPPVGGIDWLGYG